MPSGYSGTSNFPGPDNWPWLFNKQETDDPEGTILYAEHHNKLRDFILKAESSLMAASAEGDGSLSAITYLFHLRASLADVLKQFAWSAWNDPAIGQPGNVLPFEFVFTESTDGSAYGLWPDQNTASQTLVRGVSACAAAVQGLDMFSEPPLISVVLRPQAPVTSLDAVPKNSWSSSRIQCTHWCQVGTDEDGARTLVVRGMLINHALPSSTNETDIDNWANSWINETSSIDLHLTLTGVKPA